MIVKLHKNARTTPAIRAQLAASNESVAVLAKRFNLAPKEPLNKSPNSPDLS